MKKSKAIIGLVNPKNPVNVGTVLRAAGCYGVDEIYYTGERYAKAAEYNKGHRQVSHSDTNNALKKIRLEQCQAFSQKIDSETKIICVELVEHAQCLPDFSHPEKACYIFGPEDGSIPQTIIDQADQVVYIPTKGCMNLAATVNVLLYDRLAKSEDFEQGNALIRKSRDRNNRLKVK